MKNYQELEVKILDVNVNEDNKKLCYFDNIG